MMSGQQSQNEIELSVRDKIKKDYHACDDVDETKGAQSETNNVLIAAMSRKMTSKVSVKVGKGVSLMTNLRLNMKENSEINNK